MERKLKCRKDDILKIHTLIVDQSKSIESNIKLSLIRANIVIMVGNLESYIQEVYIKIYDLIKKNRNTFFPNNFFLIKSILYPKNKLKNLRDIENRMLSYENNFDRKKNYEEYVNKDLFLKDYGDIEDIIILFKYVFFVNPIQKIHSNIDFQKDLKSLFMKYQPNITNIFSYEGELYEKNYESSILNILEKMSDLNKNRNIIAHGNSSEMSKSMFAIQDKFQESLFIVCEQKYKEFYNNVFFIMDLIYLYLKNL
ncbi:hypothetical protein [Cetobacterium ceti]